MFGLGGILCAVLTGAPPFAAATATEALRSAARGDVAGALDRLDRCGADPALVALCRRCLSPAKADRPADAGEVASAVAELRADADQRARRAELDRVWAEGERAAAEARVAERHKRQKTQRVLVAVVGLFCVCGGGRVLDVHREPQETTRR